VIAKVLSTDELSQMSTAEIKNELLSLTKGRDTESLNKKVLFYKNKLSPFFEELSRRNPFPTAEEQVAIILGAWSPIWSTIPFQDILPGRIREQSYQIFHDNGYYANIARYAPGHKLSLLDKLSPIMLAYDLMVLQKFEVRNGQWNIENVGIEQAFRMRNIPLDIDKAESWFTEVVQSRLQLSSPETASLKAPNLKELDKNTVKKLEKVLLATPQLQHLYVDNNFRLVKTQREVKERPSYTIAVRRG
jgi:hypothetical protein